MQFRQILHQRKLPAIRYMTDLPTILISSSIDTSVSFTSLTVKLDLVAAQQLVLAWQLRDVHVCLLHMRKTVMWSQSVL
jgi:hypothetical protein